MKKFNIFQDQIETAAGFYNDNRDIRVPTDRLLGDFFHHNRKRFGSKDRKIISETVYGLYRHKSLIEAWCPQEKFSVFQQALCALACESLIEQEEFRILFESKQAESLYHALVGKKLPENFTGLPESELLARRYSFPLWLVERWLTRFGAETEKFLQAMSERPPLMIRANPIKTTREELKTRLEAKGHQVELSKLSPWGLKILERFNIFELEEFQEGFFEVQDEGSQLVSLALEPKPGEVIWDTCAGGGGKTLFIAGLMRNQGRVVATDIRIKKLEDVRKRAKRAGLFNIFPAELKRLNESKVMRQGVDKMLIDAPCSGTGTFRRNPDAKWKITPETLQNCQRDQLKILYDYTSYLKPGGTLVYATCSVEQDENETVIDRFLAEYPAYFRLEPDRHLYPHETGTDGFFISKLHKR